MYYLCSENKGADQLRGKVTAKLICVFVFAYAKSRFSHDAAQMEAGVLSVSLTIQMRILQNVILYSEMF